MLWIALGLGVLMVLIGCPMLLKTWMRRRSYVPVMAICVECEKVCGKKNKKYTPVFEYTYNGRTYTEEAAASTGELEVSKEYKCCVDPENPANVMQAIDKYEPLLLAIGCVLALAAATLVILWTEGMLVF